MKFASDKAAAAARSPVVGCSREGFRTVLSVA